MTWFCPTAPWSSNTLPATVGFTFKQGHPVAKIAIRSPKAKQAPMDLIIRASHDCEESMKRNSWAQLLKLSHAGFDSDGESKEFIIPCSRRNSYSCYAITVLKVESSSETRVTLADVRIYG